MTSPFPIRNLVGKKAVITGGTHGMGLAVGKALLAAGAEVLLTGRNPANVEAARLELADERARVLISDSADLGAIDQLAETVREQFGRFDFLHVNAGLSALQPIAEVTEADYDLAFNLNTKGAFFATQRLLPLLVDGGSIVTAQGAEETRYALSAIPLTRGGAIGFQVENAMAAIGAAWALNIDATTIRAGLATFVNDAGTAPGRFNVFDYKGATVIADYGHNPDAIAALTQAVETMPARRRSVVISGAGDRRDEDIRRQTEILGDAFDDVLLYQDQCQRGREDGEVLRLLREGLAGARRASHVDEIHGEFLAIDTALGRLQPGDLCLILIDQVDEALAHIGQRVAEAAAH